ASEVECNDFGQLVQCDSIQVPGERSDSSNAGSCQVNIQRKPPAFFRKLIEVHTAGDPSWKCELSNAVSMRRQVQKAPHVDLPESVGDSGRAEVQGPPAEAAGSDPVSDKGREQTRALALLTWIAQVQVAVVRKGVEREP